MYMYMDVIYHSACMVSRGHPKGLGLNFHLFGGRVSLLLYMSGLLVSQNLLTLALLFCLFVCLLACF